MGHKDPVHDFIMRVLVFYVAWAAFGLLGCIITVFLYAIFKFHFLGLIKAKWKRIMAWMKGSRCKSCTQPVEPGYENLYEGDLICDNCLVVHVLKRQGHV